mmetsp:Transcript_16522/g.37717  ORF Transcript_16522/g.37717 Transcript_16522/m.37717 type:complete len:96 (+) Transcript_16522:516-803(+)
MNWILLRWNGMLLKRDCPRLVPGRRLLIRDPSLLCGTTTFRSERQLRSQEQACLLPPQGLREIRHQPKQYEIEYVNICAERAQYTENRERKVEQV